MIIISKINKILFDPLCQTSLESKFIPRPLIIDINNVASKPLANPILYKLYPLWAFMLCEAIGGKTKPTIIPSSIPEVIAIGLY